MPLRNSAERRRRRAEFLRDLQAGRELRARLHPRRTKLERARSVARMRSVRI